MVFQLTNHQRKYLGLDPIQDHWERVKLTDEVDLFFEGDTIVKSISHSDSSYHESKLDVQTRDQKIVLPKTARGEEKKLNYTSYSKMKPLGVYFYYSARNESVTIANYSTQTTFYSTSKEELKIPQKMPLEIG